MNDVFWGTSMSFKRKLLVLTLTIGILPLLIESLASWLQSTSALKHEAELKLKIIRENKSDEIERLFTQIKGQITLQSKSNETIDALKSFTQSFSQYQSQELPQATIEQSLQNYYRDEFGKKFKEVNSASKDETNSNLLSHLSSTSKTLQYHYISNNKHPLGQKDKLNRALDTSLWSEAHNKYHPTYSQLTDLFGYYDVFLVDHETGHIVYSVFKELDFATSLNTGPYKNSGIAETFREASKLESGQTTLSEMSPYYPSYNFPAMFIGAPVFEGQERLGVLIFQIPVDKLDTILSNNNSWQDTGYGRTGEAFLFGQDLIMRSNTRRLAEDKASFLESLRSLEITPKNLAYIKDKETSATAFKISSGSATQIIKDQQASFKIEEDYRGVYMMTSVSPLKVEGLKWYLMTVEEESEAMQALREHAIFTIALIFIAIASVTVIANYVSKRILKKVTQRVDGIGAATEAVSNSSYKLKLTSERVSSAATQEASSIQETVATLNEISSMISMSVEYATSSTDKAKLSQDMATKGKNTVQKMNHSMQQISTSIEEIQDHIRSNSENTERIINHIRVIKDKTAVINDIVFQTRLLSFNASVEAARAGEQGKGFSVVAEEVGSLASLSGSAANEINQLLIESEKEITVMLTQAEKDSTVVISKSLEQVQQGKQIAEECSDILDEINHHSEAVKKAMEEILNTSKEQATGVENITTAMNEIDTATHDTSDMAHEAQESSEQLNQQLLHIADHVGSLEMQFFGERIHELKRSEEEDLAA